MTLPAQFTSFVGREREKAGLRRLLSQVRLLTLTGVGGCGKTRLALEVAAGLLARYDDVRFVDLGPLTDPRLVPRAGASALGVFEKAGEELPATLASAIAGVLPLRRAPIAIGDAPRP